MTTHPLTIGLSPCPNDTFIFGSWVLGLIPDLTGCCSRFVWQDIQNLNEAAHDQRFDVVKVSAVQAVKLTSDYTILACGGAFGLEHGPKLVARPGTKRPGTIAVPGMMTTAFALLEAALDHAFKPIPMPFDQEMNALQCRQVDAALFIHETALIYQDYGLDLLLDLGKWWQDTTEGLPLPLGVIMASNRSLTTLSLKAADLEAQIRSSLDHATAHRVSIHPLMRGLAQEMEPSTLDNHIQAYVNAYSRDMGEQGRAALSRLQALVTKQ